jgi:hypothetical protein
MEQSDEEDELPLSSDPLLSREPVLSGTPTVGSSYHSRASHQVAKDDDNETCYVDMHAANRMNATSFVPPVTGDFDSDIYAQDQAYI